jgi:Fe2+ or Zn2+ uptake regulation protein
MHMNSRHTIRGRDELEALVDRLRAFRMKPTYQRAMVLAALLDAQHHGEITAMDLYRRIEDHLGGGVPVTACYRILAAFADAQVVQQRYQVVNARATAFYRLGTDGKTQRKAEFVCACCHERFAIGDASMRDQLAQLARGLGASLPDCVEIAVTCAACSERRKGRPGQLGRLGRATGSARAARPVPARSPGRPAL